MTNADKIKNIVNALRNINIKDLQNIDARELGDMLRQRIDIILTVVPVVVTIIVMANMFKGYAKKSQTLAWEIGQMQERVEVIRESERLKKNYSVFLENFPESILTDQLINKLSEFAADRKVQILSFSPVKEKSDDYIKVAGVQINVTSDSYKNIVLFMRDIEAAPYALRVEQWSAKMKEQTINAGTGEFKKQTVEAGMEIDSIKLKNE